MDITKRMEFIQRNSIYGMIINKEEYTMKHTETKKKVQSNVNKEELSDVHYIRQAYNLPCGTCVYSDYCKKAGINKANFRERVIGNE